jgi:hypothetical protein
MDVVRLAVLVTLVLFGLTSTDTLAQPGAALPPGAYASNVRVVGYSDLDGRPGAFKMTILERAGAGISTPASSGTAAGRCST